MESTVKDLLGRRSCRSYSGKRVEPAVLDAIIEAGLYAPSAMGRQDTALVVVEKEEEIRDLSRMNASVMGSDTDPFYGAPVVIIVFAKKGSNAFQDGSLVMGNLMNAAHALGVGSCWINRAYEMFLTDEGRSKLKEWGLDESWIGVGNCILGYSAEDAAPPQPRKPGRVIRITG